MADANGAALTAWAQFELLIDVGAKISTSVSFLVALIGGWIALQTYRASVRNASSALMHGLFKDYLLLRWSFDQKMQTSAQISGDDETPGEQIAGMKLYVLEEMFSWVEREDRYLRRLRFFMRSSDFKNRHDIVSSWHSTIRTHLRQHRDDVRNSIFDWTCCYSVKFLRFVANDWKERDLSQLVSFHEQAVANGLPRPAGRKEENP